MVLPFVISVFSLLCFGPAIIGSQLVYPDTPHTVYSPRDMNVTIPCNLTFPKEEQLELLMWYQENMYIVLRDQNGSLKYRDDTSKLKYEVNPQDFTLHVFNVQTTDTANYTCKKDFKLFATGSISFDTASATMQLIVQDDVALAFTADINVTYSEEADDIDNVTVVSNDVPSPPRIPEVTKVESRSAFVSWQASLQDNNSPITNYIVKVKKDYNNSWVDSRTILVPSDTTGITVRDLVPNTAYKISVIAKNLMGNSRPSASSSIFLTLPEVPSEPPQNVVAVSPDSRKIKLSWEQPASEFLNGEPKGFIVMYRKVADISPFTFTIEDPLRKEAVIENLEPYTSYSVSILMFNEVGNGPEATVFIRTEEGAPDRPRITHYSEMKSRSFVVNWEAPNVKNGVLKNYQLQWIHNNTFKTRIITGHLSNPMCAEIKGLEPYTQYQLRVRAETKGGYSNYSDFYPAITDVAGPSSPRITNLTVLSSTSVFVQWERSKVFYKKVNKYVIEYWSEGEHRISKSKEVEDGTTSQILKNLQTNIKYGLKVAGVTQSIFSKANFTGNYSEERYFELVDPSVVMTVSSDVSSAGMIAGIVVAVFIILVAILLFVGYRSMTCRKYAPFMQYFAVPTSSQSPQNTIVFPPEVIEEDTKYKEINVVDFLQHIRELHADSDHGFSVEFDDITSRTRTDLLAEASFLPENKPKNRYVNISAFDNTRVILQPVLGKPRSSDYINGNFIDGYNKPHAYIATQGPLPHTFADYWRMIWEQGSVVIVMITNLVERGRRKCDMYWPEEGSETYGCVTVKHINTFPRAHYTVRMFSLKSSKIKKKHTVERIVYQYHYTEWPDHGVPEFTLPVLKFIQKSSGENPPGAGPIIIHCSAGVGRTGTYMLIDTMIKQIKDKGTVNIPAFLLHIRQQRNFLVQTEEQYMLIHDAIGEYILTQGDTEIRDYHISRYVSDLTTQHNGELAALDIQYSLVTHYSPRPDDMFHALKGVNVAKNRSLDMVPLSVKRVHLPVKPGVDGSDYINATYLQGYNKSDEFIITQHPLDQTVEDFWRMVWDNNISVIVQLSDCDEEEFKSYWPSKDESIDIGCFKLTYREDDERKSYMTREFLLQSTQDDYILMTRIVTPNEKWPESCQPLHQVFELIDTVQTLHKQNDVGPLTVVDRYGGVEATTFCALWSMYDQLNYDKAINVYQLAKLYHLKRAGVVGTKENYLFLYKAAESLAKEWMERDRQPSPSSIRLHLGSVKKNGTLPRSVTINSKIETDV